MVNPFDTAWGSLRKAWYDNEDFRGDPEDEAAFRQGEEKDFAQFQQPLEPNTPEEASMLQSLMDKYGKTPEGQELAQEMFEMMIEMKGTGREEGEGLVSPDVGVLPPEEEKPPPNVVMS